MRHLSLLLLVSAGCGGPAGAVDITTRGACFEAWEAPTTRVTAGARPSGDPGLTFDLSYAIVGGVGEIVLETIRAETVVQPSQGPFSTTQNSGSWLELRDAADATLYTRGVHELVPESREVHGPLAQQTSCPENGGIRLRNFPNVAAATHLVLFQEPIDGVSTNQTIELVRLELP